MGFIIGCYSKMPCVQQVDRAMVRMASFFTERGYRHTTLQLGSQCTIGWISKDGAEVPVAQTRDGFFFGEVDLYNRRQLEARLPSQDHGSSSDRSNLGVVADFLGMFGAAAIRDVNGDFVLGHLDRNTGRLRLFHDHFGFRTLYYFTRPEITYFASLVPPLLRLEDAPTEPDLRMLGMFLLVGVPALDRTYYPGLYVLPPSRFMEFNGGAAPLVTQYWRPGPSSFAEGLPQDEIVPAFRELVIEATETRLSKTGTTAFLLSGGLDSSTLASIACSRHPDEAFLSVTIVLPRGYRGAQTDERAYVEALARQYPNLKPHFEDGLGVEPLRLPDDPLLISGPVRNAFEYVESNLRRLALLQGADLVLSGYAGDYCVSSHGTPYLLEALLRLRLDLASSELGRLRRTGHSLPEIAKQYIAKPLLPLRLLRWRWRILGTDWTDYKPLSPRAFSELGLLRDLQAFGYDAMTQASRTLAEEEARDLSAAFAEGDLFSQDVEEIRTGLKTRYPFFDVTLLEAALSVPFTLKKNKSEARALLRAVARDFLPSRIAERTDKGHVNPDFRTRVAGCEQTLRAAFREFRANEIWSYLVDSNKIEQGLSYMHHRSSSEEIDVIVMNQVCRPYELGLFLTARTQH